jgi:hypothetical protein
LTATAERPITPAYCPFHGYRQYEGVCSICAGSSNVTSGVLKPWLSFEGQLKPTQEISEQLFSLDTFLAEVKDSCTNHAERKGYTKAQNSDAGDVFGPVLKMLGVAKDHAFGEIIAKLIEYKKEPRRVLAVKIAGWAWRLWLNTEK